jgi:hypothetical protein
MTVERTAKLEGTATDAALVEFVTEHYDRLLRLARLVCRDAVDAEPSLASRLTVLLDRLVCAVWHGVARFEASSGVWPCRWRRSLLSQSDRMVPSGPAAWGIHRLGISDEGGADD